MFFIFSLFLFMNPALAQMKFFEEGVEFSENGEGIQKDELLDYAPRPNSVSELSRKEDGKLIYKRVATIGSNGLRTSPAAHKKGKSRHFLFIDGSVAFGEGLNDDQTITHLINQRSRIYEAYPVGFVGYSLQHAWVRFAEGDIAHGLVKEKKGTALLLTHQDDLKAFAATLEKLGYVARAPQVVEISPGVFAHKGKILKDGTFWQRMALQYCYPIRGCRALMEQYRPLTEDVYALCGRAIDSISEMYGKLFESEGFHVAWVGKHSERETLQRYTKSQVVQFPKAERYQDGHPTPAGAQMIANEFFDRGYVK